VRANRWQGLAFDDAAAGAAVANTVDGNAGHGIAVGGRAAPVIERNVITRNGLSGLALLDEAGGRADGNRLADNGGAPMSVAPTARTASPAPSRPARRSLTGWIEKLADDITTWHVSPGDDWIDRAEQATPGTIIALAEGTHQLPRGLVLRRAVTIRGAGRDRTRLVATDPTAVIHVARHAGDDGDVVLEELTVALGAGQARAVVLIDDGTFRLTGCRFALGAGVGARGHGLRVEGGARGTVRDCEAVDNLGDGMRLAGKAEVTLSGCLLARNGGHGVTFEQRATGAADSNEVTANGMSGIQVINRAAPALTRNRITHNRHGGLVFMGNARGSAAGNHLDGNGRHAIARYDRARPTLGLNHGPRGEVLET
jgi:hypothetical protein